MYGSASCRMAAFWMSWSTVGGLVAPIFHTERAFCGGGAAFPASGARARSVHPAPVLEGPSNMEILHVALELAPFVRTSPAADAVGGLAKAQKLLGHDVSVIVPRRPEYEAAGLHPARRLSPLSLADGAQAHVYE